MEMPSNRIKRYSLYIPGDVLPVSGEDDLEETKQLARQLLSRKCQRIQVADMYKDDRVVFEVCLPGAEEWEIELWG
jgi:hypothetical protein